ncbi:ribosomal large subunit pseudouridine synthase D, partial [gut metagenome]
MERIVTYEIRENDQGKELLSFLRSQGFSRHLLTAMKADQKAIRLNGERGYGRTLLKTGDRLTVRILETEASPHIVPKKLPLSILYEDEDLLVINKPADMPVHPSLGNYENTLANAVAYYFASQGKSFVYRCINRLDRDTTGALILAKNALSAAILSSQMKQRQIHRTYLALAKGKTPPSGTISAPIARVEGSTIEREVNFQTGEAAVTHFQR